MNASSLIAGLVVAAAAMSSHAQAADHEALRDLSSRIQFASYAGEVRELQRDIAGLQRLELEGEPAILQKYYVSFGQLKLADLLRHKERGDARKFAGECSKMSGGTAGMEAKRGSSTRERNRVARLNAELWALQAACSGLEAELSLVPGSTSVSLASFRSSSAGGKALAAAPNNPRVKLLVAIQEARRADDANEWRSAQEKLQQVMSAFDAEPPSEDGMPDWGQADALAWLGYIHLQAGDKVQARNALERALVLASDYAWARELLKQVR
ncbi:MAG TPA: hypothetical protein VK629_18560 [Steroidobacteraceae bacterium]|nr:hypothetical protein [Steroidobacteraceae bacterium]